MRRRVPKTKDAKILDVCCMKVPDIKSHIGGALAAQYLRGSFYKRLDELVVWGYSGNDAIQNNLPA